MSARPVEIGEVGRRVAANIRRLRLAQGVRQRQFAARLTEAGRPMAFSAVSKTEVGERRVDVDDLAAFAIVLGVQPADLLAEVPDCRTCHGGPPAGFLCRTCGAEGLEELASVSEIRAFRPPRGRLTDEFLEQVAAAYRGLVANREPSPAVRIGEQLDVPTPTVHRWIAQARKRGMLPPAVRGKAG